MAFKELSNLRLCSIFAEQVPETHALKIRELSQAREIITIGPASVGLLIPGVIKLGAIGGTQHPQITAAGILKSGDTAVISTSGGMVNELIHTVTGAGGGISFALSLGGDRYAITSPAEALLLAENDKNTKQVIYFGELGGSDEYEIIELIKRGKVTKKIVAYIAGTSADLFEEPPQFGHAKALAQTQEETAQAKKTAMKAAGITILETLAELTPQLKRQAAKRLEEPGGQRVRSIGERQKHLIVSRISGDHQGEVQILGRNLLEIVKDSSFAKLVISMLLGQPVESEKIVNFVDYTLRLLVDHGPYVAGVTNTISAARAGKDLVSSVASGILTIGPRFGGAINAAAGCWLEGAGAGVIPKDFVSSFEDNGGIIPGIGHKKYRIDSPDPRVESLLEYSSNSNGDRYLKFAQGVEKVTTSKKGNLILNVDGAIAAILLDLLESELDFDQKKLKELIDMEFFNAIFVISRSVGFSAHYLDQRRYDEGLLRLSDKEILYFPNT
jgi:ATP citrate (pro-S)-lyase